MLRLIYVDLKKVRTWYSQQMKQCIELPHLLIASQIHVYSIWNYFPEQTNSNVIFRIGNKIWSYGRQVRVKLSLDMYSSLFLSSSAQNLAIILFQGQSCLQPQWGKGGYSRIWWRAEDLDRLIYLTKIELRLDSFLLRPRRWRLWELLSRRWRPFSGCQRIENVSLCFPI